MQCVHVEMRAVNPPTVIGEVLPRSVLHRRDYAFETRRDDLGLHHLGTEKPSAGVLRFNFATDDVAFFIRRLEIHFPATINRDVERVLGVVTAPHEISDLIFCCHNLSLNPQSNNQGQNRQSRLERADELCLATFVSPPRALRTLLVPPSLPD